MIIHLKASATQLRLVIPLEGWPGGRRNHVFCAQWASKDTSDVTTKVKERGNGCMAAELRVLHVSRSACTLPSKEDTEPQNTMKQPRWCRGYSLGGRGSDIKPVCHCTDDNAFST